MAENSSIPIYIGYDSREDAAYRVLAHSIMARSSMPVSIRPLMLRDLPMLTRPRHPLQSTEFSFSRFLVPYLCGYRGWAIFMDCDMLCLDDIAKLWGRRDDNYHVMVVKHDYVPREAVKFLGEKQTAYDKKNWSSVMLFNADRCRTLTPEYVNEASGLELHQFKWLAADGQIGELPSRWNHLVGVNDPRPDAALAHFTLGGPWLPQHDGCEYADQWRREAGFLNLKGVPDGQIEELYEVA